MLDWIDNLLNMLGQTISSKASIIFAALIGSTISVVVRPEKSLFSVIASFMSGIFAGWYLSQVVIAYLPNVPIEPIAAVLAIVGRDLVFHIMNLGKENPFKIWKKIKSGEE